MNGKIWTPLETPPNSITPNGAQGEMGGEHGGPFAQHKQTQNELMNKTYDSMKGNMGVQGGIVTPMDTSKSEMPGITGSSGSGATGGGKISSPFSSPWGDSVG